MSRFLICYEDTGDPAGMYVSDRIESNRNESSRPVIHAELSANASPSSFKLIQKGDKWFAVTSVEYAVYRARIFGSNLIEKFSAENIMLGITQAGKTTDVRRALADVVSCLDTGSLYDAIVQVRAVPDASKDPVFVSNARLLEFVNLIEDYLSVPRSTTL